jgi:phosphate transport system permease protein
MGHGADRTTTRSMETTPGAAEIGVERAESGTEPSNVPVDQGRNRRRKERIIRAFFFVTALASITTLGLIMLFLFKEGMPIFKVVGVGDFLFGREWYPTDDPADFGIYPLIVASLAVIAVSCIGAIPLGVMTAIFIAEIAGRRTKEILKPVVELLASLPSVVIGFIGMVVIAPILQRTFGIPTGLNLFNAALMLCIMSVPTICSISEDAIYSVPRELREASLALGATQWETIYRVVIPASLSGIATSIILGISRAIGETMVVLMVAGGAAMIPGSIFDPVRPMPASIAAEMGEAPFQSDHYHALFATGIILFLMTFAFNIIADQISHRYKQVGSATL